MIAFIVNPVSGNGRGAAVWNEIEGVLQQRSIPYTVCVTQAAGQAEALTRQLVEEKRPRIVVAVGGDGTVKEVANGIYKAGNPLEEAAIDTFKEVGCGTVEDAADGVHTAADPACALGFIAAGSGNDFARGHGLPLNHLAALEIILSAPTSQLQTASIDVMAIGDTVAVSTIGVGLDGQVAKVTNEASYKRWLNRLRLGKLSYVLSLVRVLLSYRPCDAVLTIDGIETRCDNVWLIAVANIRYYGGGMMICPNADPQDGFAEVCVVSNLPRWELLRLFPLVYSGKHANLPYVRFFRGRSIYIQTARPLYVHTDGEAAAQTPIHIEVLPNKLRIIKP